MRKKIKKTKEMIEEGVEKKKIEREVNQIITSTRIKRVSETARIKKETINRIITIRSLMLNQGDHLNKVILLNCI